MEDRIEVDGVWYIKEDVATSKFEKVTISELELMSSPLEKLVDGLLGINESNEVGKRIDEDDWNQRVRCKPTLIKGSYKDELPPSDYQLDN